MTRDELDKGTELAKTIDTYERMLKKLSDESVRSRFQCCDVKIFLAGSERRFIYEMIERRVKELKDEFVRL